MAERTQYMNLSSHEPQQLYREQEEEDDDEALSLCDLPLHDYRDRELSNPTRSSSELFEFFIGDSQMCPAEDIIFCGKLVPYKDHRSSPTPPPLMARSSTTEESNLTRSFNRRKSPRSAVSPVPEIGRNSSVDDSEKKVATTKPRWYLLLFGIVKLPPPEMDLRDMKSRQFRRSPSVLFPVADDANSRNWKSTWGLLRALSCKDHTSIAVTTSFRHMPEA